MKKDTDGFPRIGRSSSSLGVRVDGPRIDTAPDENGRVKPGTGGMSVSPTIRSLPPPLVPKQFRSILPGANGPDTLIVWQMGSGPFEKASLTADLALRPDRPGHGLVEPIREMTTLEYEEALAATRTARSPVAPTDPVVREK